MDCHGLIIHGVGAFLALSEPFTPKDSSWCTEIMLFGLHQAALSGKDLRVHECILQADNTPRECKNNTLVRIGAVLTGLHRVRRLELRFLSLGHSHEDVDQWFSTLASLIEANRELHASRTNPKRIHGSHRAELVAER